MKLLLPSMILMASITACGGSPNVAEKLSLDALLRSIADEAGLAIIDVSVPFERLARAPAQLKAVNRALQTGPSGVYVMRYADDTLRRTLHAFVIGESKQVYVRLSTAPDEDLVQEQHDIHASSYEENTESLILDTSGGVVRLTPQDVTPVGA